jgi:hypothetical protein
MKKCLSRRDLPAHVHIAGVFGNFGILVILGGTLTPENTLSGLDGLFIGRFGSFLVWTYRPSVRFPWCPNTPRFPIKWGTFGPKYEKLIFEGSFRPN